MKITMKPGYIFAGIVTLLVLAIPGNEGPGLFGCIFIFVLMYGYFCLFVYASDKVMKLFTIIYNKIREVNQHG